MSILISGTLLGGGTITGGAGDLSAKVGYWAKTVSAPVISDGDAGIAIIVDGGAAAGDPIGLAGPGCTVRAIAGGTVAANDFVTDHTDGTTITCTSGMEPVGRALTGGSAGEWITIFITGRADESIA